MIAKKPSSHLGVGLYSLAEASRLVGAPASTISNWTSPEVGLVPRQLDPQEKTITFIELMELHFIKLFRKEGVSLQTIRKTSAAAAALFGTEYPFAVKRFDTDGKTVFATLVDEQSDSTLVEDLKKGQLVFETLMKPFFRKLDYHNNDAVSRFWPRDKTGRIVLDPARKFGKPIDAETGIATRVIYDAILAGNGQDRATVADWLGIPIEAVEAAVAFEQSLSA